jgi:hypothetical protein
MSRVGREKDKVRELMPKGGSVTIMPTHLTLSGAQPPDLHAVLSSKFGFI